MKNTRQPAPRNRTLRISEADSARLDRTLLCPEGPLSLSGITDRVIRGDLFQVLDFLPDGFADLLFLDPPYNIDKDFHGMRFAARNSALYLDYLRSWFPRMMRLLKPTASVYLCGDWRSAAAASRRKSRRPRGG